jgi:hypothetical protein
MAPIAMGAATDGGLAMPETLRRPAPLPVALATLLLLGACASRQSGASMQGSSAPDGSLSGELSRSRGVIAPPPTGDQGVVPPPAVGPQSTPVIPPPGSPGGRQDIVPK